MNPVELARRLDQRFRLLTGGERTAIERHQTLRATIDWSYDLLTEPEQRLLARLAVFAGGATLEAVEAVCPGDPVDIEDIFDALAGLVARSLVVADDAGRETRYRLLETIRQYSEERLAGAGETDVLRRRHADHYIDFAGIAGQAMYGPGQIVGRRLAPPNDKPARRHEHLRSDEVGLALSDSSARCLDLPVQINVPWRSIPSRSWPWPARTNTPDTPALCWRTPTGHTPPTTSTVPSSSRIRPSRPNDDSAPSPVTHRSKTWIRSSVQRRRPRRATSRSTSRSGGRAAPRGEANGTCRTPGARAPAPEGYFYDLGRRRAGQRGLRLIARRSGMPTAISVSVMALALSLATDEPGRAHQLFAEAESDDYENHTALLLAVFTAGRLQDWPGVLRAARRLLEVDRRTGQTSAIWLAGILNLVARGLAQTDPPPRPWSKAASPGSSATTSPTRKRRPRNPKPTKRGTGRAHLRRPTSHDHSAGRGAGRNASTNCALKVQPWTRACDYAEPTRGPPGRCWSA